MGSAAARRAAKSSGTQSQARRVRGKLKASAPKADKPKTAKSKTDVIARLVRQGKLERRHQIAADEIEGLVAALRRPRYARAALAQRVDENPPTRDLIDRLSGKQERLLRTRYGPWLKRMAAKAIEIKVPDGRGGWRDWLLLSGTVEAVLDVVCDNAGLAQVEAGRNLPRRTAAHILREGLERYCQIGEN